jgi:prolyl oligopeptidase
MVSVPDPYRFLEDRESKETQQWVEAENKLTADFLGQFSGVTKKVADRMKFLSDSPKMSFPEKHGDHYYFLHSRGLQNQPIYYKIKEKGSSKADKEKPLETSEVFLDPNTLAEDGTTAFDKEEWSKNG